MLQFTDGETIEVATLPVLSPTKDQATGRAVRVRAAGLSHAGKVRLSNEDHFITAHVSRSLDILDTNVPADECPRLQEPDGYVMAVADGVGGQNAGERASRFVLGKGIELLLASAQWGTILDAVSEAQMLDRVKEHLVPLNESLRRAAEADPAMAGMATTLTAMYTVGLRAFVVHVGDSRAHILRGGRLQQITRDHTIAQDLADEGKIAPEAIRHHPRRHVLTNVIAAQTGILNPDVHTAALQPDDMLLLCTDGLSDLVSSPDLTRILVENPRPKDACQALIDAALERGGRDNATAVVAQFTLA